MKNKMNPFSDRIEKINLGCFVNQILKNSETLGDEIMKTFTEFHNTTFDEFSERIEFYRIDIENCCKKVNYNYELCENENCLESFVKVLAFFITILNTSHVHVCAFAMLVYNPIFKSFVFALGIIDA